MKKVIGWILFLCALGVIRIFQYSASLPGKINWFIGGAWIAIGLLCLFGFYMLVIYKNKRRIEQMHKAFIQREQEAKEYQAKKLKREPNNAVTKSTENK